MGKLGTGLAVTVALILIIVTTVAAATRPPSATPPIIDMTTVAQALHGAGTVMETHGQQMLADGQRTGNQNLAATGQHWLRDGKTLVQQGKWLTMDPTAPVNLHASPAELAQQGNWGQLNKGAQAMLHDPGRASAVDLAALRWDGAAMRSEGQEMRDHAQVMSEEIDAMEAQKMVTGSTVTDLRQATAKLRAAGASLQENGQAMMDYADQLRRSLGYR